MQKLYAFDVGGDAFLLKKGEKQILVDGGQAKIYGRANPICKELKKVAVLHIDIAICTHHDGDHIKGLIKVFKSKRPRFTFNELWIPAFWAFIEDSSFNAKTVYDNLNEIIINEFSRADSMIDGLDNLSQNHLKLLRSLLTHSLVKKKTAQWINDIYQLLILAKEKHCTIRYFHHGIPPTSSPLDLFPVNSCEIDAKNIAKFKQQHCATFLDFFRLSWENTTALAFYSPETAKYNGVLFCADSNLSPNFFNHTTPPTRDIIVTAPHHGSDGNDSAYGKINIFSHNKNNKYVRGSSHLIARLSNEFKKKHTLCTSNIKCNGNSCGTQNCTIVHLQLTSQKSWHPISAPHQNTRGCP
ncbi:MBL fold metallo-hydrolase [Halodesulfovibrio sp.]|uniref:MBL fold metallo-hydrolase n=1 Tax=Halodesulfovibrio sp. TaxID=1912772 RepID=UPI0025C4B7B4|nr:MBL fold metallo-hydrolase [Halodesulfovibrio sp.]